LTCPDTDLRWVSGLERNRALRAVGLRSTVRVTDNLDDVLADPRVEAVAVATPAWTHFEVALASLEEGKHVLVDKPFASSVVEGESGLRVLRVLDIVPQSLAAGGAVVAWESPRHAT
jgi:predicted dehydrogenase